MAVGLGVGMLVDEAGQAAESDRGAFAPTRRRAVSMRVREVRERLTSDTGLRPAYDRELTRQFAQNRLSAALAIVIMVLAVGAASSLWASAYFVTIWLVSALSSQALMVVLARHYISHAKEDSNSTAWRLRFLIGEAINGLCWAVLATHLWGVQEEAARLFVLFLMMLVVGKSTMLSATLPLVMLAGALPAAAAVIGVSLVHGSFLGTAMAAMTVGALAYFLMLGGRLNRSAVEALEFRAEKDALIAELEQAKANSDEARRRAEEANLAKSRFLATMSHELRTPLNAILGFSEVMKSEIFGPLTVPHYKEYVSDIHDSGQHLLNLINEILDLSRIEAGRYELKEEAINLAFLVEDCQHLLKLRAKAKGIVLRELFEPNMPMLWADERAIRQVALNLLSNAIKFTPQGGEVTLKVGWTASGGQYVSIRDTGPGIPPEEIPTVMSSFGRGSLAIKTAEQGTGLGLPIVKGLVDLHGGTFVLRSKPREGTEVIVTFPASRVMEALAPVVEGRKATSRSRAA
jgi:two-component system cell cycle sensor histidine kinase PleC